VEVWNIDCSARVFRRPRRSKPLAAACSARAGKEFAMLGPRVIGWFVVGSSLIASGAARAQGNASSRLRPITAPVKDAGVYHLGLGTWTRHVETAALAGQDIIYANTCNTGYFGAQINGETWSDEGRVPSTSGPVNAPNQNKGCQNGYAVSGFQIAYCTSNSPHSFACTIGFQARYATCAAPAPMHSFVLTGLPGCPPTRAQACWLITIDLSASSQSFLMVADGTGTFPAGDAATDHLFGWQFTTTVVAIPANTQGPIISGQSGTAAAACSGVDGTRWDTLPGAPAPTWPANTTSGNVAQPTGPEDGLGMDTQDHFRIDHGPVADGCYWFGGSAGPGVHGNPLASFHLRLFANAHCGCVGCPGHDDCVPGVNGVIACPCNNPQVPAGSNRGCNNSSNTGGAQLTSTGNSSLANDTVHFTSAGEKPNASTILLQGKDPLLAAGIPFGQGVRCIDAALKRLYVHSAMSGTVTFPQGGDPDIHTESSNHGDTIAPGSTRHYMCYYRDPIVLGGCSANDTWNATPAQAIVWTP
jgi:hypothetical protein